MSEQYVQVPPNSTGSKLRTLRNTISGNDVEQQVTTPGDSAGNLANPVSATLYDGQNASVTTTAAALASSQAVSEVLIQADPTNTDNILVGNATSQHVVLVPGASLSLPVTNLNVPYVKSASGTQKANYVGRS